MDLLLIFLRIVRQEFLAGE